MSPKKTAMLGLIISFLVALAIVGSAKMLTRPYAETVPLLLFSIWYLPWIVYQSTRQRPGLSYWTCLKKRLNVSLKQD
jgi:hypothetical protein